MALKFVFWDVQHGNATYVSTPSGRDLVVDLGTGSLGNQSIEFSPLLHLKNKWNVESLDGVILTHPHRDHLDDIFNFDDLSPRILTRPKHLSEEEIREGNQPSDKDVLDKYFEIDEKYCHPVDPQTSPYPPENNGGVTISKFFPQKASTSNLNNHSVVTIFDYAGLRTLIPGDNEAVSWKELLDQESFVAAIKGTDVLLAPHHGRDAGFCSELFDEISPRVTVISDGPPSETNAANKYARHTRGWTVHKRSGGKETRKVVTTRKDGVVVVECGTNTDGGTYLKVTVN